MAGNYPDVPSWRMAYDRDGTQVFSISSANVVTALSEAQVQALNDESDTAVSFDQTTFLFWFPELRDLDGFYINAATAFNRGYVVQVSADTTNGIDGTWVTVATYGQGHAKTSFEVTSPAYRSGITSISALGIRAVRVKQNTTGEWVALRAMHLFGEPIPGANPNRLALWHPTLDQRITPAFFDWGDVPRSSSADKQFRVKNLSGTLTANSVRVAQEVLTDAVPSVPGQHTLSLDGATFLAQVNVGSLGPGSMSAVVTLRRVTPSNAQLSVWAHRVFAEANSWS